jgi:hypothetical protein
MRDGSRILDAPHTRGMTEEKARSNSPAARMPGLLPCRRVLEKQEGAGNAGCLTAPAASCALVESTRVFATGTPNSPAFPAQWLTGLCRALPGVPGLLASVARRIASSRLDPSVGGSGPHGFAVREGRARLARPSRPSQPVPTFVAIGQTPLLVEAGWAHPIIFF